MILPPPKVSFEFFPPKTPEMEKVLWSSINRLAPLAPQFVSVTYGAGGSTRERTHETVCRLLRDTILTPAAHLTCVDASCDEIDAIADRYWEAGVRHIVALRGDTPSQDSRHRSSVKGYVFASDLVKALRRKHDFDISVAAYPETHPEAISSQADLDNLKRKVDAGATRAITQMFFDNNLFFRFRDRVRQAGIHIPLIPGILPITNFGRTKEFAQATGTTIPSRLHRIFETLDEDPGTRHLIAAAVAAEQCRQLVTEGVHELHFYTLNRADLVYALCHLLDVRPQGPPQTKAL